MSENRVVALRREGAIDHPLTEILRAGARRLIAQAVEAEFETFLASNAELVLADGRQRVVRHGHLPEREVMTGIGPVDRTPAACARPRGGGRRSRPHPVLSIDPAALYDLAGRSRSRRCCRSYI